jgi:hypothetical protein
MPRYLIHQEVEARITLKTVEIFMHGKRVASHLRCRVAQRRYPSICPPRIAATVSQ